MALRAAPLFETDFGIFMAMRKPSLSQSDAPVSGLSTSCEQPTQLKMPTVRRPAKTNRQLTPQRVGVAWEKVRRVVRDLCRQSGRECPLCQLYGNQIEFQYAAEYQPISLELHGDRIVVHIGSKKWTVRIVRIKTGGSGYQLRRKIRTATWLLIELLKEARGGVSSPHR
jgi:hypothetical protein